MVENKTVRYLAQLTLSLLLLVGLLWAVGVEEVIATLTRIQWNWYLLAFGLFVVNVVIRAYRWYVLLRVLNDRPSFAHLVYLYFLGFFANIFIPSSMGGDIVKVLSLRSSHGKGTEALSSVVMERLTGLLGSAIIALLALGWNSLSHTVDIELPPVLWTAVLLLNVSIPAGVILLRWTDFWGFLLRYLPVVRRIPKYEKLENLVNTVQRYPWVSLGQALLVTLPFTISLVLMQYAVAQAFGVDLPLTVFAAFVPIIAILTLLPIAFNGLGLREGLYLTLFVPVGVPGEIALSMSLATSFLRTAAGLLGGVFYAARNVMALAKRPSVTPPSDAQ